MLTEKEKIILLTALKDKVEAIEDTLSSHVTYINNTEKSFILEALEEFRNTTEDGVLRTNFTDEYQISLDIDKKIVEL